MTHSVSFSQQAQCGLLYLVMVVQCAPYSRFSQRRRLDLNHDLHHLIKAIASMLQGLVWNRCGPSKGGVVCGAARTHTLLDFNQGPRPDPGTVGSRRSNAPSVSRQKLFCTKTTAAVAAMRSILEWRGGWNIVSRAWERKLRTSDSTL